jgi:hypothetical protein
VGTPANSLYDYVEPGAGLTGDQRVRPGTRRAARPARSWFESWAAIGGKPLVVDLVRSLAPEGAVGAVFVVPTEHQKQFGAYSFTPRANDSPSQPLLDCQNGPFQHGKTAVLP